MGKKQSGDDILKEATRNYQRDQKSKYQKQGRKQQKWQQQQHLP
jgi:hypothetical protein